MGVQFNAKIGLVSTGEFQTYLAALKCSAISIYINMYTYILSRLYSLYAVSLD